MTLAAEAPLTRADRESVWAWRPAWGEPMFHDQHVREYLMQDDAGVRAALARMAEEESAMAAFQADLDAGLIDEFGCPRG